VLRQELSILRRQVARAASGSSQLLGVIAEHWRTRTFDQHLVPAPPTALVPGERVRPSLAARVLIDGAAGARHTGCHFFLRGLPPIVSVLVSLPFLILVSCRRGCSISGVKLRGLMNGGHWSIL
jgi:hypothetical protein